MDELVNEFINEAREHLATVEQDLLTIEESGADIDEELVNKVFRAAHSIKGGAGFFGFEKVKELAHKAETVLDMLRSKKIVPNAEVTNILLAAFDRLRDMINNPGDQENTDIGDLVLSLTGLVSSYLPPQEKGKLSQTVTLQSESNTVTADVPQVDFERVQRAGQYVYAVPFDLIHDVERKGRNILQVFQDLEEFGEVLDCSFELTGSLDEPIGNQLPLRLLFATGVDPVNIHNIFELPANQIQVLSSPTKSKPPVQEAEPVAVEAPVEVQTAAPTPVQEVHEATHPAAPTPSPARSSRQDSSAASHADETLRVNVGVLDTLMNLAGELVLSRNQLRAAISQNNVQALTMADQRLNLVTSELQDAIMRTRLQPIGNVFGKFPRVVRDMAASLGKEIEVDILGKDVALDRSLIEGLSDPLTHMVRNSVDHGVESPDDRAHAGKSRVGKIRIEARHEAGQVVVEIADDGKGIDARKIAEAALAKGLVTQERLRGMSDQDKIALIFLPGLSTATKVSDISGRGVGMDVVKTNLDRLSGQVEIKSEVGKGTLFRIKLPLTLAIIPSLIVAVGRERFAIPQINVEELLRIRPEEIKRRIEVVGGAEVLLLRDEIIPLVRFDRMLGITLGYVDPKTKQTEIDRRLRLADRRSAHHPNPQVEEETPFGDASVIKNFEEERMAERRESSQSALEIVVVHSGQLRYGLVVNSFHNTEEIVVKPLGRDLKALREYAGATILGDGTVALILDLAGLAEKAELASVSTSARALEKAKEVERSKTGESLQQLFIFHNAPDEVCAVPLDSVLRLERITPEQVENQGNRRSMRYRGTSLPLVTLSDTAQVKQLGDRRDLAVIVSRVFGREVGLLGAMPLDVIETKSVVDTVTHRQAGICGSLIIRDNTTLIADITELVESVYPEWRTLVEQEPKQVASQMGKDCILLAEDSDFFRAQVKKYLEDDGFIVLDAPDGEAAWELLNQNLEIVQAVVTDIEMPRLTGIGLAKRIRADARTAHLPIIALSSLAAEEDMAKGREAGVNEYQVKLDRDRLLVGVNTLLSRQKETAAGF